ncbi:MAG TPA: hypothetical protein VGJ89_09525 [Geothrix sp.]
MVRLSEQLAGASRISATGTGLSSQMMTTNGTITHPVYRGA